MDTAQSPHPLRPLVEEMSLEKKTYTPHQPSGLCILDFPPPTTSQGGWRRAKDKFEKLDNPILFLLVNTNSCGHDCISEPDYFSSFSWDQFSLLSRSIYDVVYFQSSVLFIITPWKIHVKCFLPRVV